jgi:Mrp family chromosome partitioning ATPase
MDRARICPFASLLLLAALAAPAVAADNASVPPAPPGAGRTTWAVADVASAALGNHPLILPSQADIAAAVARKGQAQSGWYPAVNLSTVLGQLGLNVLLVDSDLHRPRLHQILGISNARGLASVLAKPDSLAASLQTTKLPGVTVLPAGPGAPNPSGLLASDGMRRLLRSLEDHYDLVILDSPPVLLVADALVLGSLIMASSSPSTVGDHRGSAGQGPRPPPAEPHQHLGSRHQQSS